MPRTMPAFVLDTNAWLDLLVFDDPALHGFAAAVEGGEIAVMVDARALEELGRVVLYPTLALSPVVAERCRADASRLSTRIDVPPMRLPRCRDPDDQIFLEIAVAAGAAALLTRDAELLRMAPRMAREHGLAIVPPARWREAIAAQISKR